MRHLVFFFLLTVAACGTDHTFRPIQDDPSVVVITGGDGNNGIWFVDAETGKTVTRARLDGHAYRWAVDRHRAVWVSLFEGGDLYRIDALQAKVNQVDVGHQVLLGKPMCLVQEELILGYPGVILRVDTRPPFAVTTDTTSLTFTDMSSVGGTVTAVGRPANVASGEFRAVTLYPRYTEVASAFLNTPAPLISPDESKIVVTGYAPEGYHLQVFHTQAQRMESIHIAVSGIVAPVGFYSNYSVMLLAGVAEATNLVKVDLQSGEVTSVSLGHPCFVAARRGDRLYVLSGEDILDRLLVVDLRDGRETVLSVVQLEQEFHRGARIAFLTSDGF